MSDQKISCKSCGGVFVFTEKDQAFYTAQNFTPPKRCKPCRDRAKQERDSGR